MARVGGKRPLVVFGEDWGAHPSSTQHIMKRLAADREIIWVNSIGLRRPRLTGHDVARAANKLGNMFKPTLPARVCPPSQPANMTIIQPQAVCWPGNALAAALNAYLLPRSLKPALARLGQAPILWTSLPTAIDAVGLLGEQALVYYAGDDFSGLSGVDHAPVAAQERELIKRADLVLGASDVLAARLRTDAVVVPHGYDEALFRHPAAPAEDLPSSGPVAGFYGSISDWLDQDLVVQAAEALPDWTFVFIGAVQTNVSALSKCPNVRLLGPRPHAELARYSQHWTASLLPFHDNRQIRACNPLKLREYLAAGRPVISTDFPALAPYRKVVDVVQNAQGMVNALRRAQEEDDNLRRARMASVEGESWDSRAEFVDALLERLPVSAPSAASAWSPKMGHRSQSATRQIGLS